MNFMTCPERKNASHAIKMSEALIVFFIDAWSDTSPMAIGGNYVFRFMLVSGC
jgi:hypothetical protein